MIKVYLVLLSVTFALTAVLTPLIKRLALRFDVLDQPAERKVHVRATPLLGGLAIFVSFMIGIAGYVSFYPSSIAQGKKLFAIIMGSVIMAAVGIYDDCKGLDSKVKLLGQLIAIIAAGLLLFRADIEISLFIRNPTARYILTLIWMVGITNSLNLLDNMNGLSAGITVIASLLFFLVALQQQQHLVAVLSICICGSALGFLPYNFPGASIFMGDGGSLFLGFSLASLSVIGVYLKSSKLNYLPVITPLLVLAVPILDTLTVVVIRKLEGVSVFTADKNHLSHQLVRLGLSPAQSVLTLDLLALAVGLNVLLLANVSLFQAAVIL